MADLWDPWLAQNTGYSRDPNTGSLRLEHDDGSITIDMKPNLSEYDDTANPMDQDNIAEKLSETERHSIVSDLLEGIQADKDSRKGLLQILAKGIDLLGYRVDSPRGDSGGAPLEGTSNVQHPMLAEACQRFQANARGELLPTDGPVKVSNEAADEAYFTDEQSDALEKDMNHYLTVTATEYYPDTDRMLFTVGKNGCGFKKVYHCPLRNRPVSESVSIENLIISSAVTDLANAPRKTHVISMRPSTLRRMQLLGEYRDVDLSTPTQKESTVNDKGKLVVGLSSSQTRPEDIDHTIYECYCELDIPGYEHKIDGKPTGLPLPYKVTIEVDSEEILQIVPNIDNPDDELPREREVFVMYPFIYTEEFGLYPIGLLHILGNSTNAVTAAWRELLDAGMFSNFPGFLYLMTPGQRQMTNEFRVPPGGGAPVQAIPGMPIQQTMMPLPYKEASPTLMQLVNNVVEASQRSGGTADIPVGEGRQDAPVGTTLAMIEQATKVESAIHKRLHAAQAKEFQMLKRLFKEDPEALFRHTNRSNLKSEQEVRAALENADLVPKADPNTHSRLHRLMKMSAALGLRDKFPGRVNDDLLLKNCFEMLGFTDADQLVLPPQPPQQPPVDPYKMGDLALKQAALQQKDRQMIADMANDQAQRKSDENLELLKMARELAVHPEGQQSVSNVLSSVPQMLPAVPPVQPMQPMPQQRTLQ